MRIFYAVGQRFVSIEGDTIRDSRQRRIAFRHNGTASFECHLQEEAVNHRDSYIFEIEVGRDIRLLRIAQRRDRFFCAGCDYRVEADNRILRRQLIVGHLNRSIFPQHGLKAIDCGSPGEILDVAKWLSHVPSDDHPVRQFVHVAFT